MAKMTFGRLPPVLGSYGGMKPQKPEQYAKPVPGGRPLTDFGGMQNLAKPMTAVETAPMVNDMAPVATRPAPQPVGGLTRPMNPYGRRRGRF